MCFCLFVFSCFCCLLHHILCHKMNIIERLLSSELEMNSIIEGTINFQQRSAKIIGSLYRKKKAKISFSHFFFFFPLLLFLFCNIISVVPIFICFCISIFLVVLARIVPIVLERVLYEPYRLLVLLFFLFFFLFLKKTKWNSFEKSF